MTKLKLVPSPYWFSYIFHFSHNRYFLFISLSKSCYSTTLTFFTFLRLFIFLSKATILIVLLLVIILLNSLSVNGFFIFLITEYKKHLVEDRFTVTHMLHANSLKNYSNIIFLFTNLKAPLEVLFWNELKPPAEEREKKLFNWRWCLNE